MHYISSTADSSIAPETGAVNTIDAKTLLEGVKSQMFRCAKSKVYADETAEKTLKLLIFFFET